MSLIRFDTRSRASRRARRTVRVALGGLAAVAVLGLLSCTSDSKGSATQPPAKQSATQAATPKGSATPTADKDFLKLLKVEPVSGPIGTPFTVNGEGLPAGKEAEFLWATVDGAWKTTVDAENVQFNTRVMTDKRVSLGKAQIGADGKVSINLKAPDDYGEVHELFVAVAGTDVAKGGFRITRQVTISPESGPIGTPITIKVTGVGSKPFESMIAMRYDNLPTGIMTSVTTRGTATAVVRAAGKAGKHVIDLNGGARSVPFLNNQQSGTAQILDGRVWFTVTDDKTMPADALDWPDPARVAAVSDAAPRTTSKGAIANTNTSATLTPNSGPITSKATLQTKGLQPNAPVELYWVTARGNRMNPSGWALADTLLGKFNAAADGTLSTSVQIPDDLGGWHVIKVVSGDKVVNEVPYFVEHSIANVTPRKVKAGEKFTVQVKGIGWTELDNGVAMTYDNAYIGFACGFNSSGDVTIPLIATGEPGIHLIDLYPMIYQGHGDPPWGYQQPILTFKDDAPGLSLGYKLPTMRLAIEVIP